MKSLRRRLSPAVVISTVALVLAAGGTSLAATPVAFVAKALGLSSKQKSQVKTIAESAISARASGLSVHFATTAGSATNATTATSAATATNATNATNATHAASATAATTAITAAGLSGVVYVVGSSNSNPAAEQTGGQASCPEGDIVLSGGIQATGGAPSDHQEINSSYPFYSDGSGTYGWEVYVDNGGTQTQSFSVYAVCASGTSDGATAL
jgi:hypothetical protein